MPDLIYEAYMSDEEAIEVIERLKTKVDQDDIYVITHDDHTDRVTDRAKTNTVGVNERGVGDSIKNIFRNKEDKLRAQLMVLGFSEEESNILEEQLDQGVIIVVSKKPGNGTRTRRKQE
ncbi:general stress protein [Virgibacillus sp. NKC19-16]|nr:general stress protein [Virgibacillus sp. NKC19-16]